MTLLSVVIPTRNRASFAVACARHFLEMDDANLEVVIQDSSDDESLRSLLPAASATRLVYNYAGSKISMTENFDHGAAAATGEFVSFIGDDDSATRHVVDGARLAKTAGFDALTPASLTQYYWPDFASRLSGTRHAATLYVKPFSGAVRRIDARKELTRTLRRAAQRSFDMPKVYYGIVRRSVFQAIHKQAGHYFDSASPDMWGSVTVSLLVSASATIDAPLFVPGTSSGSKAGSSAMRQHVSAIEDAGHISARVAATWPERVPRFFSVETVWAEAAVRALQAMHATALLREFDFGYLYARCLLQHPHFRRATLDAMAAGDASRLANMLRAAASVPVFGAERAAYYARRLTNPNALADSQAFRDVGSISEAVRLVEKQLDAAGGLRM